jgi:hypothetical protein
MEALPDIHADLPFLGIDSDKRLGVYHRTLLSLFETMWVIPVSTPLAEHQAFARVYRSLCPFLNYFLPAVRLVDKQ